MPQFRYTAVDKSGKRLKQTAMGATSAQVVEELRQKGFTVISIEDTTLNTKKNKIHLKQGEKIYFTQNLSVLLSSGISLGEALSIMSNDVVNKDAVIFYHSILSSIESGYPLSKALGQFPYLFDTIYLSLVEAGENSGQLDIVMDSLAKSLERDSRIISQVRSAMMYPAIVLISLFMLGTLITFFVLPKMATVFESLNVHLPLMTRLLLGFSKFAGSHVISLSIAIVVTIIGFVILLRLQSTKRFFTNVGMHTPLFKQIISNMDLARLSSTLGLLLNAGVPIQNGIRIAAGTVRNPKLSEQFKIAAENLAAGKGLAQTLQETSLPRTFIALVSVGERSGNIANVFGKLAEHYQDQLDTSLKTFTGILEPLLTLMVGLVVGGMVIIVMLPLYSIFGSLEAVH